MNHILKIVLIMGILLRPLQMAAMAYLGIIQWRELRNKTPYQPIKKILLWLFILNFSWFSFSLFIDLDGVFNWFPQAALPFLVAYLAVNVMSGMLITILLLVVYHTHIEPEHHKL